MKKIIHIIGAADGTPTEHDDRYLVSYDPHVRNYSGHIVSTDDRAKAMLFADGATAFQCWRQTSRKQPWRPDGKPNRPLTAFTIEVENL